MSKPGLAALALTSSLLFAFPPAASASVVEALDLRQLVDRADVVVVGTTMDKHTHWDDRGRIVTDVTLRIDDALKGVHSSGTTITVRRFGGSIGDLGMKVPGEPAFERGKRKLLFGRKRSGTTYVRPVGMAQGALAVRMKDGEPTVFPSSGGVALVRRTGQGKLVPAPAAVMHPRPLEEVLGQIRALREDDSEDDSNPTFEPGTDGSGTTRPR